MKKGNSMILIASIVILALTFVSSVTALILPARLIIHNGGNIWAIDTSTVDYSVEQINIATLKPIYYTADAPSVPVEIEEIQKVTIKDGQLLIFFYGVDVPKTCLATRVEYVLTNGTAAYATGEGFAWGRR